MWTYIFLGVLQGLFEWLPISSEGVVALTSNLLVDEINPIEIALFLHLGTVLAVLIYFRDDWKQVFNLENKGLIRFLIISTLVSLIVGFPVFKLIENTAVGASLLLITGFGLLFTAYFHKTEKRFGIKDDKLAIIAGLLQGLAVIPGFSRSGSTIFGLSLGKLTPEKTLKLSYMMSVPVVLASSFYLFLNNPLIISEGWISLISGFFTGILSLNLLMNLSKKMNFFKFALIFSILCFAGAFMELII
jgi:undecaprenyl-diphosphatase